MFKKKNDSEKKGETEKVTKTVVTKTVERTGGVRTTTTTFNSCTKDGVESALRRLELDPEKFSSGGTTVTKTIVYTDSSGKKEVMRETVETYGDPDTIANEKTSKDLKVIDKASTKKSDSSWFGKKSSPKTASSASTKSSEKVKTGQFEEDCLKAHNDYRKLHGVPPLKLSKEICAHSREWADHLAATDSFKHRTQDRKYGENIFMKWSSDPNHMITGKEAVDSWYSEIKDHVFGREPTSLKSGHFTQVIWKESQHLGVAWSRSKTGKILVVANYDPTGNFVGKFAENVPPPK